MPAWWSKKSHKTNTTKSEENNNNPYSKTDTPKRRNTTKSSSTVDDSVLTRVSLSGSSGFSGFDSDSVAEQRGLPLPRPCISDPVVNGSRSGSASGSVSSVSSSGSSGEDPVDLNHYRGRVEMKFSSGSRSPGLGSRSPILGSRSPAPGSRTASKPTSPLHPRFSGMNLESPTGRLDDGWAESHPLPLPLPPGSPSSPSMLMSSRVNDNNSHTLSTWKKGKLLGRGTFGHVYLGFNSHSGQMCAIKEVRVISEDSASKESLKQLNQEINLLSQLSHPNIVRYFGSEMSEETLSVYLEYVSGGSIHKLLQEYGAFKEPVIQNYTRQILSGLAYLHGRNTVHRDIKGANILVDPNGEIKLADFGMAKHITAASSMLSFKGSPYWMAPEVVMNMNGYSLSVDIWSLGCTILEMATSKPPWSQYEGVAAIFKIGNSKDIPDIPDHLSNVAKSFVKLCLQRDPSARPTALQLLDHHFVRDQGTTRSNTERDALSSPFDGSRSPPLLELHPSRNSFTSTDGEFVTKNVVANTRTLRSARDDMRVITSLPVSPCSSPLRQYGPAHRSCYTPPHPTYSIVGQNGYNLNEHSTSPFIHSSKYMLDPFIGSSLKGHTPGSSPRTRPIL